MGEQIFCYESQTGWQYYLNYVQQKKKSGKSMVVVVVK